MARNDVKVKLKLRGLNKLMRSAPIQAEVNAAAGRLKAAAGEKFQVKPSPHRWTARAFVEPKKGEHTTDEDVLALLRAVGKTRS